jgi:Porin subfamily
MSRSIVAGALIGAALVLAPDALQAGEGKALTAKPNAQALQPCPEHGPGFVRTPGGGACVRVGGRVRVEAQAGTRRIPNDAVTGLRAGGRLDLDARAQTDYGPVRAFVRVKGDNATGSSAWGR